MGRKKKIWTTAIPHISQEPHECGKLSGVQIFLVQVTVKMCDQILLANLLAAVTPSERALLDCFPLKYSLRGMEF